MFNITKEVFREYIAEWKLVHLKPRHQCSLNELMKKEEECRYRIYAFTFLVLITLFFMLYLFYVQNVGSLTVNTILIISFIALYDEERNRNNLQHFIYMKQKEMIKGGINYG